MINNNKQHNEIFEDKGGSTAVLFVHGILGSPSHFEFLSSALDEGVSYLSILLPGHGKEAIDFANSSMEKWQEHFSEKLNFLRERFERIVIVTHSMGGLIAMNECLSSSDKVCGLFMLAPSLKIFLSPSASINSLRIAFLKAKEGDNERIKSGRAACSVGGGSILSYLKWTPRYLELFSLAKRVRDKLKNEKFQPSIMIEAIFSSRDELVLKSSKKYFENQDARVMSVEDCHHFHYCEKGKEIIKAEFIAFLGKAFEKDKGRKDFIEKQL